MRFLGVSQRYTQGNAAFPQKEPIGLTDARQGGRPSGQSSSRGSHPKQASKQASKGERDRQWEQAPCP